MCVCGYICDYFRATRNDMPGNYQVNIKIWSAEPTNLISLSVRILLVLCTRIRISSSGGQSSKIENVLRGLSKDSSSAAENGAKMRAAPSWVAQACSRLIKPSFKTMSTAAHGGNTKQLKDLLGGRRADQRCQNFISRIRAEQALITK